MIKKLRLKFIAISVAATALVLFTIVGGINLKNYLNVNSAAERTINLIAENDGKFPSLPSGGKPSETDSANNTGDNSSNESNDNKSGDTDNTDGDNKGGVNDNGNSKSGEVPPQKPEGGTPSKKPNIPEDGRDFSPEAPFMTRYFTVTLRANGAAVSADVSSIAALDENEAKSLAETLFSAHKTNGYSDDYKYASFSDGSGVRYIFLDCSRDLDNFRAFLRSSAIISAIGFAAVTILIAVLSGLVTKPAAEAYLKQKRFITDANHELKTPLTVIDASRTVLEMENGINEWTETIKEQVQKLTELTNKLVFLSRFDEGNEKTVTADFPVSEVAEEAARPYIAVAKAVNKTLSLNITPALTANGDPAAIKQLIEIMLDNAVKYADDAVGGGKISFSLSKAGRNCKFVFENDAVGVPKGDLNVLFERFYRLDTSRNSKTGGSGIGLSVAQAIVLRHKGKISACSPDGKRIVFTAII